jgi:hypothetical protein
MSSPKRPPVNPTPILVIAAALIIAGLAFVPAAIIVPTEANVIAPVILLATGIVAAVFGVRERRKWIPYRDSTTPEQRKRLRQEYVIVRAQEDANKWVK